MRSIAIEQRLVEIGKHRGGNVGDTGTTRNKHPLTFAVMVTIWNRSTGVENMMQDI